MEALAVSTVQGHFVFAVERTTTGRIGRLDVLLSLDPGKDPVWIRDLLSHLYEVIDGGEGGVDEAEDFMVLLNELVLEFCPAKEDVTNEATIWAWRAALAGAIEAGVGPTELVAVQMEWGEGKATVRRLANTLDRDKEPLPAAARVKLGLASGASFEDAIASLRERWDT